MHFQQQEMLKNTFFLLFMACPPWQKYYRINVRYHVRNYGKLKEKTVTEIEPITLETLNLCCTDFAILDMTLSLTLTHIDFLYCYLRQLVAFRHFFSQ